MKRLLIVEDEEEIRESLKMILSDYTDEIYECGDGIEALEFLQKNRVEAIISDIKMPRMEGLEFIQWMRNHNLGYPVIVLTGHGDAQMTERALRLGAFDFLSKPCALETIIDRVTKAIELGVEYNRWTEESTALADLHKLVVENSTDAIDRLKNTSVLNQKKKS